MNKKIRNMNLCRPLLHNSETIVLIIPFMIEGNLDSSTEKKLFSFEKNLFW